MSASAGWLTAAEVAKLTGRSVSAVYFAASKHGWRRERSRTVRYASADVVATFGQEMAATRRTEAVKRHLLAKYGTVR
ncbi:hypothetical protein [Tersicoccus sp. Bi-70]|uniref:hypothetical protein n=1 Tax=Tersicoccus sp. Bi-70 TaxID=1897634 RepID=UPI0009786F5E|nr:hypothetical protein [Tersicoccus sp. Bi-70]OMH30639.1 hypothetical protein BGP79_11820 [Tersicoccus sp. Bi-70]